jgi:hypothetical protein
MKDVALFGLALLVLRLTFCSSHPTCQPGTTPPAHQLQKGPVK